MGFQAGASVLKADGIVWSWGCNSNGAGELGDDSVIDRSSPVAVVGNHFFKSIRRASYTSYGLKFNGTVWSWGDGYEGALGINQDSTSTSSPVPVVGNHAASSIGCGNAWGFFTKSNGQGWAIGGNNDYGNLGDGTITLRSSPVLIVGLHSFVQISAGHQHSLGRKADGSVWGWGANSSGYLGNNSIINRSSPVAVVGSHSFVDISAGAGLSVARKANGEAWCWGYSESGNNGDNTVTPRSSPVLVVGNHSFIKVKAGWMHVLALKANGEAWAWGWNQNGQLGNMSGETGFSSPVLVVGNHSFIDIYASQNSYALKADGSVWAWGSNYFGDLGTETATTISKSSPVLVVGNHYFSYFDDLPTIILKYRTGNSIDNCQSASWVAYTVPFTSLGYVQLKLEA